MKAWVYSNNQDHDNALKTAEELDEDSLSGNLKLQYYRLMEGLYSIKNDKAKQAEYDDKYWALYDEMFDGGQGWDEELDQNGEQPKREEGNGYEG